MVIRMKRGKKMNKGKRDDLFDVLNGLTASEQIERYGRGASEYIKGYKGTFDENGNLVKKGLKQVAESNVNKDFKYQNLKQQAGFSAEIDYVSKTNSENIINGTDKIVARSNDVGRGNDTRFDIVSIDNNGNVILNGEDPMWGAQMKFCGGYQTTEQIQNSSENLVKKLASPKWDRYRDNEILIPKEQYEPAKKFAQAKCEELRKQSELQRQNGNYNKAAELEALAEKYNKISENIKDSGITSKEAMFLREHPKLATAKNVAGIAHKAGVEQAKGAAIMAGTLSVAQNVIYVMKGDKEIKDALYDSSIDIAKGTALGYITGSSDAAIRGFMASSNKSVFINLSKTSLPSMLATTTIQVTKSIKRYANNEIDEIELVQELGEKGTGMLSASLGAAVGTAILPGVGTVVGGMVGYMTSSSVYSAAMEVLKEAEISKERYLVISSLCEASIESLRYERERLEKHIYEVYGSRQNVFDNSFNIVDKAIGNNDITLFTQAIK